MSATSFTLNALDVETGVLRWDVTFPEGAEVRDVVARSGVIVIRIDEGGSHRLIALDGSDGTVMWEVHLPDVAVSRLRCTSESVAVATMPLSLVAYRLSDGSVRWDYSEAMDDSLASGTWCSNGYPVHDEAVELERAGQTFLVGTREGLMALSDETGEVLWGRSTGTVESIQVQAGDAYVVDMDSNLHRLDIETGESVWSFGCETEEDVNPVLTRDVVLTRSDSGDLCAIEVSDGTVRWRWRHPETGAEAIAFGEISAGQAFVTTFWDGFSCHCLDAVSGEVIWSREFGKVDPWPRVERASGEWCLVSVGGELRLLDATTGAELGIRFPAPDRWGLLRFIVGEADGILLEPSRVSRLEIEELSISWSTQVSAPDLLGPGTSRHVIDGSTLLLVGRNV